MLHNGLRFNAKCIKTRFLLTKCSSTLRSASTMNIGHDCIIVAPGKKVERKAIKLQDLGVNVHPRDVLALDIDSSNGSSSSRGSHMFNSSRSYVVLPRKDFFLISYGNVKSLIVKGHNPRMLLFEPDKSVVEDFAESVNVAIPNFATCIYSDQDATFELGVIEEVLKEACSIFDRRIRLIKPLVQNLLQEDDIDGFENLAIKLQKLGPLEDAIQVYEMEIKEARNCLVRLLQNDEDMHGLVSTQDPAKIDLGKLTDEQMSTIASVELLLESYIHKINRNYDTLIYFRQKLNTWKSMTSMSMQMKRNKIMNYNLHMAIAAVSIGTCSACAGIFGMNLTSGIEEHPYAFYLATGTMIAAAGTFQLSLSKQLFGRDLNLKLRKQASRIQGMKTILIERADILDDAIKVVFDVLDDTGRYKGAVPKEKNEDGTESSIISKDRFHKLFLEQENGSLRKNKSFSKHVGQLFDLLDVDKNAYLDRDELSPSSRIVTNEKKNK